MLQLLLLVHLISIIMAEIYVRRVVTIRIDRKGMMLLMGVAHHRRPRRQCIVTTLGLIVWGRGIKMMRDIVVRKRGTSSRVMGMRWMQDRRSTVAIIIGRRRLRNIVIVRLRMIHSVDGKVVGHGDAIVVNLGIHRHDDRRWIRHDASVKWLLRGWCMVHDCHVAPLWHRRGVVWNWREGRP